MSAPIQNYFDDFERLSAVLDNEDLLESRFENDGNGNPIYIGYTLTPNASIDEPIWYIIKIVYDLQNIVWKRIPEDGRKFAYIWSQRASYFP